MRNFCFSRPKHQSGANLVWPVMRKFKEMDLSCDNSPHEVGQDIPVLVLATAFITVQVDLLVPQPIVLKVVVEIGYDGIGPLAATVALINEVVDLPGDALHAHSKDAHLSGD